MLNISNLRKQEWISEIKNKQKKNKITKNVDKYLPYNNIIKKERKYNNIIKKIDI